MTACFSRHTAQRPQSTQHDSHIGISTEQCRHLLTYILQQAYNSSIISAKCTHQTVEIYGQNMFNRINSLSQ